MPIDLPEVIEVLSRLVNINSINPELVPEGKGEGAIAHVNEDLCSGCRMCEGVCEFGAVEIVKENDKESSHVIEELCKGCGVCGSTCPSGAITLGGFTDRAILSQVRAALQEARR